ncbi:hypothetical protein OAB43_02130 [Bacteroidia bacterium]|jgi:hypothetical protein|nr:hypothetical protein [Bacteroidia bacterium]|tara:strand:+ start:1892 stop:2074 length:183 start_codon:yes stop_codon:yes gene_type:complete
MIILQELSQKLPNSAQEPGLGFWTISVWAITAIIFIGVYYIFNPVFSKEKDKQEKSKNKE